MNKNKNLSARVGLLSIALLVTSTLLGCFDDFSYPGNPGNPGNWEPEEFYCDRGENEPDEGPFLKPQSSTNPWYDFRSQFLPSNLESIDQRGFERKVVMMRDAMRFDYENREGWLYPGESALIDVGYWWDGYNPFNSEDLLKLEVFVFVNLKPVDFAVLPVDPDPSGEPFPMEEEATYFGPSFSIDLYRTTPLFFTLVVPPESLGETGAKDIRVLFATRHDPADGSHFRWRNDRSSNMILNYGGRSFPEEMDLPDLVYMPSTRSALPESWRSIVSSLSTLLLPPNPPAELSTMRERADSEFMNQVQNVDSPEFFLDVWSQPIRRNHSAYLVPLDGNRVLDGPEGLLSLPTSGQVANYSLRAQLEEDQIHTLRMAVLDAPFCRNLIRNDSSTKLSNPVFLRYRRD